MVVPITKRILSRQDLKQNNNIILIQNYMTLAICNFITGITYRFCLNCTWSIMFEDFQKRFRHLLPMA